VLAPRDLRQHPGIATTSGEDSVTRNPTTPPPPRMTRATTWQVRFRAAWGCAGATEREDPCCHAMMGFSPAWEANCNDVPPPKCGTVAKDGRILRVYVIIRRGLHGKPPTYKFCETMRRGEVALEQGPPATPPYKDYHA
jgi:hypothetical protein